MAGNYYPGVPTYGYSVFAAQRYPAITDDAFNPVAAGPVRQVGPSPMPVLYGSGNRLDASQGEGNLGSGSILGLKSSMVPWILVGLGAILWLHYVHF